MFALIFISIYFAKVVISTNLLNGDFELINSTAWTTTGPATSILNSSTLCHTGHRCAKAGKKTRTFGISSFIQTFTIPPKSQAKQISFWYSQHCAGDDDYVYSSAILSDSNVNTQILYRSCSTVSTQWRQVVAPVMAGHTYTINISTYEDGSVYFPAYTLFDSFTFLNYTIPTQKPSMKPTLLPTQPTSTPSSRPSFLPTFQPTRHNHSGVVNSCFQTGNFSGWKLSGNASVIPSNSGYGYYAQFGNTDTRGYVNVTQTFMTYSTSLRIEISYQMQCYVSGGVILNDWATAYLIDPLTNITTTILPLTCQNTTGWAVAFASVEPNHVYTLVLASLYGTYENPNAIEDEDVLHDNEMPPYTLFGCTQLLDNNFPTVLPTLQPTSPTIIPSITPSVQPSSVPTALVPLIPGDFPLPVVTAKSIGALFASSPFCTGDTCPGSSANFAPTVARAIQSNYLNGTTFKSTYYDLGSSSAAQSASFALGGTTVGQISSPTFNYNAPCTQLNQIVKGSTVYVDDFTVAVRYAAADSVGRLKCAYTSVSFTINNGGTVVYTGSCAQTGTNPTGLCSYTGTDKTYFTGRNLTTVVTMNAVGLVQPLVTTRTVYFNAAPTALTSYDSLRAYIYLPKHPVYAGDLITIPIYLYSPSQVIDAIQLYFYYPSQFTYVSGSLSTTSYQTATAGTSTSGQLVAIFNSLVLSKSQAVGYYQLGQFQFVVSGSSTASLSVTGTLTSMTTTDGFLICAKNQAGLDCSTAGLHGNYFTGATDSIYFADMMGAPGHTPGLLSLVTPVVSGVYATSSYVNLVNTARMTGTPVTDNLYVYGALSTYRSSFADIQISGNSLSCTAATDQPSNVLSVAPYSGNLGCLVSVSSANTVGSSAYTVTATYSGYTVTATYRVYVPSSFVMRGTRRSLRRISSCLFESSYISVLATLTADASNTLSNVDVTSLLTLAASDNLTATYSATNHVLQGISLGHNGGFVQLIPTGASKNISIVNNTFHVSSYPAKIKGLYTFAYSSSTVSPTPTFSQSAMSSVISVSASLPVMNDETTYSGLQPVTNFAKLVTFAQGDDGYFTDVSQYPGLSIMSADSLNVNATTYKDGSGKVLYWYAYVPSNAASATGNVLISTLKDTCGRIVASPVNTTQQGYIFTSAGIPYGVTVAPNTGKLTSPGSCASKAPINLPTKLQLTVTLLLKSVSGVIKPSKVMTTDSRTQYAVAHADAGVYVSVNAVGLIQVAANSTSGTAIISVTFPRYSGAGSIQGNVTISVVECTNALSVTTTDFPGKKFTPFTSLKLLHCSGRYQSSLVQSFIKMTDNSQHEVTSATVFTTTSPSASVLHTASGAIYGSGPGGVVARASAAGKFNITGSYCNSFASVSFTAAGTALLTSLTNYQYGSTSAQQPLNAGFPTKVYTVSTSDSIGCGATSKVGCAPSSLSLNFDDGTTISYSQLASIQATPQMFLVFSSNDPSYVFVNTSTGALSALQNSYQYARVTANVFCLTPQATSISVYPVAANLYPADNDIKTGYYLGLSYVQYVSNGIKMVEIPIQVKPKAGFLIGAWDTFFYFKTNDLSSGSINVTYTGHRGSKDVWAAANPAISLLQSDATISYVHLLSNSYTTVCTSTLPTVSGALTLVATLHIPTTSASTISYFLTQITGLILNPIGNTALSAQVTVASSSNAPYSQSSKGFVNLNNGTVLESPIVLARRLLDDKMNTHSTSRHLTWDNATFILTGDISGNKLLGYEDVIDIQNLYAKATSVSYGLQALRNAVPTLSYMPAISSCGNNYCNYGSGYTTSILTNVLSTADVHDISFSYLYNAPMLQFPFSQTPCDMATLLPNSNPHRLLQLDAIFYSPPTNVRAGGPILCQSNLYKIEVFFETNYKLSQIVRVVNGGNAISYNPASTIIGPATCNGNGLFTVTVEVNQTTPDAGVYTAAVYYIYSDSGVNTTFSWLTDTSSARHQATDYTPIYISNNCPSFPSTVPTSAPSQIPTQKPTNPTVQPSSIPSSKPSKKPTSAPSAMPSTVVFTHSELNFTQVLNYVAYCNQTLHNPGIKQAVTRVLMLTLGDILQQYVTFSVAILDLKISSLFCESLGLNSTVLKAPPVLLPVSDIPSNAPTSFPSTSCQPSNGPTKTPQLAPTNSKSPSKGPTSTPHAVVSNQELLRDRQEEMNQYEEELRSKFQTLDSGDPTGSYTFGSSITPGTDDSISKFQQVFSSMDVNYQVFFTVASTNSTFLKEVYDSLYSALGKAILFGTFDTNLQKYAKSDTTAQYGLKAFLYTRSGGLKTSGYDIISQRFLTREPTNEPTISIEPSSYPITSEAPTKLKVPNVTISPSSVRVITNSVTSTSTEMASGLIAGIVIIAFIAILAVLYVIYRISHPLKYEDRPIRNPDEVPSEYNPRHSSLNNLGRDSGEGRSSYGNGNAAPTQSKTLTDAFNLIHKPSSPAGDVGMRATTLANQTAYSTDL